jgi:hypothetical protein
MVIPRRGARRLADDAEFIERPINEDGFAVDGLGGDGAPGAGVVGGGAVVAEDIVAAFGDGDGGGGGNVAIFVGDIVFDEGFVIDVDSAGDDFDAVAGEADDAFDVAFGGVAGEPEDDGIAAADLVKAESIAELVDKNTFLVNEGGHHGGAFDLDRLIEEEDDKEGDNDGEKQVSCPAEKAFQHPSSGEIALT